MRRLQKRLCCIGVLPADVTGNRLQITENILTLLPARTHSRLERIFAILERPPVRNFPRDASFNFSSTPGGVSLVGRSQSGQIVASNRSRSPGESLSIASMI